MYIQTNMIFFCSQEIVSEFLRVFENNIVPKVNLEIVRFKCTFTLIYRQLSPMVGFAEIMGSRVWVTNIYEWVY